MSNKCDECGAGIKGWLRLCANCGLKLLSDRPQTTLQKLTAERDHLAAALEQLRSELTDADRAWELYKVQVDTLRALVAEQAAELAATRRELHRWQHGEQIEGDYVCRDAAENQHLRAALDRAELDWSESANEANALTHIVSELADTLESWWQDDPARHRYPDQLIARARRAVGK